MLFRSRFFLHLGIPQMRVFDFDLVDHIDTDVQVHRLIPQDVLELFGHAGHFVAAAHGQNLGEAAVKEDAFQDAVVRHQITQQLFISLNGAGFELRIGDRAGVLEAPGGLLATDGISWYMLKISPSSMASDSMQYW